MAEPRSMYVWGRGKCTSRCRGSPCVLGIHGLGLLCKSWEDEEESTGETCSKVSVRCLLTFEWSGGTVPSALVRLSIW